MRNLSVGTRRSGKVLRRVLTVFAWILSALAFLAFYSANWYVDVYGQLGFDSILYTLLAGLNGVESDLIASYMRNAALPALLLSGLVCTVLFLPLKSKLMLVLWKKVRIRLFPLKRTVALCLCFFLSAALIFRAAVVSELTSYLQYIAQKSTIYETEYRDPNSTAITFPEEKRNLIYIFLESMETTYFSSDDGGFLPYTVPQELYALAQENISFSHHDGFGGLNSTFGTVWTIGAMVGQTAGVPLRTPPGLEGNDYGGEGVFLPGITNLTDILRENGYYQALMVGSDGGFGGRSTYYATHGADQIYDLYTARADGIVPDDYYVWWGMEDLYLFEYARQELTKIAAGTQPFAFTMLTVDTHHISGYRCTLCQDQYGLQYENVISCSSRQVLEFVRWIQAQDFYENTTIVLVGDHPSMDNGYIQQVGATQFDRRIYNCFINSAAVPSSTQNRSAVTLDMFPTTLAALGCTIEGDRLGLGTNLFSDTPTLSETMGLEAFDAELSKSTSYYTSKFFFSESP